MKNSVMDSLAFNYDEISHNIDMSKKWSISVDIDKRYRLEMMNRNKSNVMGALENIEMYVKEFQ
jgi:hypothetical protein